MEEEAKARGLDDSTDDEDRVIDYNFGPSFLELKTIGMQVGFSVGDQPVKNLRLIEKHFFKDELIKTYDFSFGFIIPNTRNTWETIYDLPELTEEKQLEIISSPGESRSDSYFFVGD